MEPRGVVILSPPSPPAPTPPHRRQEIETSAPPTDRRATTAKRGRFYMCVPQDSLFGPPGPATKRENLFLVKCDVACNRENAQKHSDMLKSARTAPRGWRSPLVLAAGVG